MSRDGYLPPGVEQEDIDRHYENRFDDPPEDRRELEQESPDDYDPLDIIDRRERDNEIAAELAQEVKAEQPELIGGVPFYRTGLSDIARCFCGAHLDCGGEIKEHIRFHAEERLEAYLERD